MVQQIEDGIPIEWIKGMRKGQKMKVSKADADKLSRDGWVKTLDAPPKDKAVKGPPKKK